MASIATNRLSGTILRSCRLKYGLQRSSVRLFSVLRRMPSVRPITVFPRTIGSRCLASTRRYSNEAPSGSTIPSTNEEWPIGHPNIEAFELITRPDMLDSLVEGSDSDRVAKAFSLVIFLVAYLNRWRNEDTDLAFLNLFATHQNLPATSEISRARRATAGLIDCTVKLLSSVPPESSVRQNHPKVFELLAQLTPVYEMHIKDLPRDNREIVEWKEFWQSSLPSILELASELTDFYDSLHSAPLSP